MAKQKKSLYECSFGELDMELVARGAQVSKEEQFKFVKRERTLEREDIYEQTKAFRRNQT